MRWCFLPLCFVLVVPPVSAEIVLNEVYYDHPGRDDGHEFIELFNPGAGAVSLAGYSLEFHDGNGAGWRCVWQASAQDHIEPQGLFVVGGENVAPVPDTVVALALQNGPDAVRLVEGGVQVDMLGYGALDDPHFFEGRSAPDVTAGHSLGRFPDGVDSNDNAADFRALPPSPGRFNRARRDVGVVPGESTPVQGVLGAIGVDVFSVVVANRGIEPIAAGVVSVEPFDSTSMGTSLLPSETIRSALAVGDSAEVRISVTLDTAGYHFLRFAVRYPGDERPGNDRIVFVRRVGTPPIRVSEVLSHPAPGCPEFVELFNAGALPYSLAGHRLRDAANTVATVPDSFSAVLPGAYVVLTGDVAGLRASFPGLSEDDVVQTGGRWPSLNHSGSGGEADSVVLADRFGLPIDGVAYPPQGAKSRGRSLERVDLFAGAGPHVWVLSTDASGATPARPNTSVLTRPPTGRKMVLSARRFDPYAGERLLITVPGRRGGVRTVMHVFDIGGRSIRNLGSTVQTPFVFVWDGTGDDGRVVTPGVYIVACELDAGDGRVVEKAVVGCAKRRR